MLNSCWRSARTHDHLRFKPCGAEAEFSGRVCAWGWGWAAGVRLLQKMGWRQGTGVGRLDEEEAAAAEEDAADDAEHAPMVVGVEELQGMEEGVAEEGKGAGAGAGAAAAAGRARGKRRKFGAVGVKRAENTLLYRPTPKHDLYGLGYGPLPEPRTLSVKRMQRCNDGVEHSARRKQTASGIAHGVGTNG